MDGIAAATAGLLCGFVVVLFFKEKKFLETAFSFCPFFKPVKKRK